MEQVADTRITSKMWATFMFISLSQQAEGWAYVLKDQFNFRTKQVLNTYLNSARSLMNELQSGKGIDLDDLIDEAVVWSDLMKMMIELPLHKQQALFLALKEFLKGSITIEDENGNLVQTIKPDTE